MIDFTQAERDEANRLNATLARLPRFRMQTAAGRVALNGLLWAAEVYPSVRDALVGQRPETRSIGAGRRPSRVRIFHPDAPRSGLVLHIHGGGWTIGNARMSDRENRQLAADTGATIISVDYRLALSRPLDAVIEECAAVGAWVLDHAAGEFGAERVVFAGSSAGAHLAAAALLRLRNRRPDFNKITGALLSFGLYDLSGTKMVREAGPETLILHGPTVRTTLKKLTPDMSDAQRRDAALSPLFADLHGLPPALFSVGDCDMLLEDSERMAERWDEANGNATLIVAPQSPHAFDRFDTAIARKVKEFSARWIRDRLGP